jgi:NADH-quinone oxidoreductase subunit L
VEKALGPVHKVLKNKYYFDELYDYLFVKPAYWFSETFTSAWMDRGVIDGFLHLIAQSVAILGNFFRNKIDKPIINELVGDGIGKSVKQMGQDLRPIQTGKIQQYMMFGLSVLVFSAIFFYFFVLNRPF